MPLQWIIFAGLSIAFAIFAAVTTYWPVIIAQPPSAAAFLGALAGAGGGLLAIILGALLNAELNRRRDDRLRDEERKAVAVEAQADMVALLVPAVTYKRIISSCRDRGEPMSIGDLVSFDLPHREFLRGAPGQLGVLGPDLCVEIAVTHMWLATIRQHFDALRLLDSATPLDAQDLKPHENSFAELAAACQHAVEALEAVTGKSIRQRPPELNLPVPEPAPEPGNGVATK